MKEANCYWVREDVLHKKMVFGEPDANGNKSLEPRLPLGRRARAAEEQTGMHVDIDTQSILGREDAYHVWLSTYDLPRPLVQDVLDP